MLTRHLDQLTEVQTLLVESYFASDYVVDIL